MIKLIVTFKELDNNMGAFIDAEVTKGSNTEVMLAGVVRLVIEQTLTTIWKKHGSGKIIESSPNCETHKKLRKNFGL